MGVLSTVKEYGYESDPNLKGPKHGPYETILDKTTGKEKTICLCTMCGKKNIHKQPGPAQHTRIRSSTDLS